MIVLVDVSEDLRDALARLHFPVVQSGARGHDFEVGGASEIDAVVLGQGVVDPIQRATQAYRLDPSISVVILGGDDGQCERIRAALRFAPMIGRDVVACAESSAQATTEVIKEAVARTRARRNHRSIVRNLRTKMGPAAGHPLPLRERYAASLMELAPIGIIATDTQCRVVSANAEATRILAVDERSILGLAIGSEALGEDFAGWRAVLRDATKMPGAPHVITRMRGAATTTLEAWAVAVQDASGAGYLVVFQDVTERRTLEQQRQEALERAEEASRLKDEFIATLSHELRTPLNAILGWARLLRSGLNGDKQQRAIETIERNALAQAQLIEDLLDMTRITTGKMRLEVDHVDLVPIIHGAIETVRPSIEAKQVQLSCVLDNTGRAVAGDPHRLQQIVWNLLSNAVKFSPKGAGRIDVVLEVIDAQSVLTVSDNGQGIDPVFLPHIFENFRQADASASRRHGGLGLGLAIVKHLVELHGGTIDGHSDGLGQGASFTVRLPLAPIRAERRAWMSASGSGPPAAIETSPPELRNLRVLVVDDEADSRELVANVLTQCGAKVREAESAVQALDQLDAFQPNVIVSDIGMPGEDGYAFMRQLRALPRDRGGATPAAALTAYTRAEDRRRALESGFQMHVAKPVEFDELLNVVATLARMARLIHEPSRAAD